MEAAFLVGAAMGLFKLLFKNYVKDAHTIHFSVPILAGYLYYLGGGEMKKQKDRNL